MVDHIQAMLDKLRKQGINVQGSVRYSDARDMVRLTAYVSGVETTFLLERVNGGYSLIS